MSFFTSTYSFYQLLAIGRKLFDYIFPAIRW
jgi:hypothetical protein